MADFQDKKMFGAQPHGATAGMTCGRCEQMLMDAMDGVLSAEEQAAFDLHLMHCADCTQRMNDATRGMAWLHLLKDAPPAPPASLVNDILLKTSGLTIAVDAVGGAAVTQSAGMGRVLAFRPRFKSLGRMAMHPRLAMTAAMAFFSIALTLNLFGVHVTEFRLGDLKPANLKHTYYSTNAKVARYYDNLRVVYELQSRVHDLRENEDHSAPVQPARSDPSPAQKKPATPEKKSENGSGKGKGERSRRDEAPQNTHRWSGQLVNPADTKEVRA